MKIIYFYHKYRAFVLHLRFRALLVLLLSFPLTGWAQNLCSSEQIMQLKNQSGFSMKQKEKQFLQFRKRCKNYPRAAHAALADLYFAQQNYKKAKEFFAKAYDKRTGVSPINNDEMRAKYALTLHYEKIKEGTATDIFMALRDKYNDQLPDKINQLYATYHISRSQQITSKELVVAALSSTRSFKNLVICPSINVNIQFAYNSDVISAQSQAQIEIMRDALMEPRLAEMNYQYELIGHTDNQGDAHYNQRLSEQRARSVKRSLIALETTLESILSTQGKGETELKLKGNTEDIHRVNRRVEIRVACDS